MLETLGQDVKFAVRLLRQSPLFTLTASLSLAIGIGANATIFGVASAMLLRPMPGLADSGRLMDIGRTQEGDGFDTVSYPNYRDFKERTKLFQDVYAIRLEPQAMSLGGPGGAERVYGTTASANYFSVLGATAHAGRLLRVEDDAEGGRLVAVISHDLWQRRFGGDPSIAGRSILINTHPFTIVGVAPRGFQGTTLLRPEFRALRLPLTRGRDFAPADTSGAPPVAIINEVLARRAWPDQDPIGRHMEMDGPSGVMLLTVVGVTADAKLVSLNQEVEPFIYVPMAQHYMSRVELLIRSTDGRSMLPHARALLREMNPNLPVTEAMPLREITALGVIPQRIAAAVAASLGAVALLLAAIGIFGVTSYAVSRRTREIGIRMALGADRASVRGLVLRQGLSLATIGIAAGVVLAALGSRLVQSLLFGVPTLDPIAFGGAAMLFVGVTLAASYIPARRATNVNPIEALRNE